MDVGEVQSIRFVTFYFCLFRKVWSSQEWESHMQKAERKQEIATLEEICGANLSSGQKLDLILWAHISQQRLRVNACQFQVIEEKMRGYFDNIFYLRLHRKASSFFAGQTPSSRNWGWGDDDILLFLLSHRILPLHTMEYILGFWRAVGRFADAIDSRNEEGGAAGGLHRGPCHLWTQSAFVLKSISIRAIILQDRYKYQLENRHP